MILALNYQHCGICGCPWFCRNWRRL